MAEPHSYLFDYFPYKSDGMVNSEHTEGLSQVIVYLKAGWPHLREEELIQKVITWLTSKVSELVLKGETVVIAVAPGHSATPNPSGFMHDIVQAFFAKKSFYY